jgi:hypothetical protein
MIWVRRVVPMLLGAGLLYLGWRLLSANGAEVDVDFLAGRVEGLALWKALAGSFGVGVFVVGCVLALQLVRGNLTLRSYRRRLSALETEVHQLRNLPLAPSAPQSDPVRHGVGGGSASSPITGGVAASPN